MEIEFADHQLSLIETERAADTNLPVSVIQAARLRLSIIRAAPDFRTMKNWKSLGLDSRGAHSGEHSIALATHWTMVLAIKENNSDMAVIIKSMNENVRGAPL